MLNEQGGRGESANRPGGAAESVATIQVTPDEKEAIDRVGPFVTYINEYYRSLTELCTLSLSLFMYYTLSAVKGIGF